MTEEIKEILDTPIFMIDNDGFTVYINDKIENYITNLQKENQSLKEKVHNQKLANAYATIQNNKLQTRLKTYKRRKTAETQKKRIYKQRNEKAIEYIKKEKYMSADENCEILAGYRIDNLLNILQGGDE